MQVRLTVSDRPPQLRLGDRSEDLVDLDAWRDGDFGCVNDLAATQRKLSNNRLCAEVLDEAAVSQASSAEIIVHGGQHGDVVETHRVGGPFHTDAALDADIHQARCPVPAGLRLRFAQPMPFTGEVVGCQISQTRFVSSCVQAAFDMDGQHILRWVKLAGNVNATGAKRVGVAADFVAVECDHGVVIESI